MERIFNELKTNSKVPAGLFFKRINSDNRRTELQWHREPELVYIIDGEAEYINNGSTGVLKQGEFILLNSEDVHLVRSTEGNECSVLFLVFSFDYLKRFRESVESALFDIGASDDAREKIGALLEKLAQTESKSENAPLLQSAYVNEIYYLIFENCLCSRRSASSAGLKKNDFSYAKTAIRYINENYKREIPLEEIASKVNLSPSYFSKYFKKVTGISFSEYLANLRLGKAFDDMLQNNASVSSAALENGFANVKSFITQCKKVYGCTPAQRKKRIIATKK